MDKLSALFCSATIFCVWMLLFTEAQLDRCIYSRLDVLPCTPNMRTTLPGPNEQGIYRTRIFNSRSGVLQCLYKDPNRFPDAQILKPIDTLGSPYLRLIFSPGLLEGEGCQDYIEVNRGEFGTTESCGTEPQDNAYQLEEGSFTIIFRTSESTRGNGFEMYVICFNPEEANLPGCSPTENTTINLELLISELFGLLSAENDTEAIHQAIAIENACNPVIRTIAEIVLQIATGKNATRVEEIRRLHDCVDATQVSSIINEEAIRQAILNEFACNPTIRTTAEIILQIATDHNTTRVEEIRRLLEAPPTLDFDCSLLESGGTITVNCFADDEAVSMGNCSIDNQQQVQCLLPLNISIAKLTPGNHSITVSVTQNGISGQETVPFVVNRLSCHSHSSISGESIVNEVTCTLNNDPLTEAELKCSVNSAALEPCTLPLIVFGGGTITVSVTVDGRLLQVTLQFGEQ